MSLSRISEDLYPVLVCVGLVLAVGMLAVFMARQEAAAFNRCHPGANVTTWEALFAESRIQDCPGASR